MVNFGYSKQDYETLTPREKAFIYKAWENKLVSDTSFLYNSVFTATYNVNRPKRKRALKLWRKAKVRPANKEVIKETLELVKEVEKAEGNDWVRMIYEKNGLKFPEKEGANG